MVSITEVYELAHQKDDKAIYFSTTGDALDGQPVTLSFSQAGYAIKAPDSINISVSYEEE